MRNINVKQMLLNQFGTAVRRDTEIDGSDAVEFIGELVREIQKDERNKKRRKKPAPTTDFELMALRQADELARAVLADDDDVVERAEKLKAHLQGLRDERRRFRGAIERAIKMYGSDDIEIHDDTIVSDTGVDANGGDRGTWVNAWLWVPKP